MSEPAWQDMIDAIDAALYDASFPGVQAATWKQGQTNRSANVHLFTSSGVMEDNPFANTGTISRNYLLTAPVNNLPGVIVGTKITINSVAYVVTAGPYDDGLGQATCYLDEAR